MTNLKNVVCNETSGHSLPFVFAWLAQTKGDAHPLYTNTLYTTKSVMEHTWGNPGSQLKMTKEEESVDTLEYFSGSMEIGRTLRFKTKDGTAVCLEMKLTTSEHISDKDWENAQFRFQDVQRNAVEVFQDCIFREEH